MTEGPLKDPLYTQQLVDKLMTYPLKRLFFVTIKDNSQKTKWINIGKVNDWIRRYSTCYHIVMGTHGGKHFHLIAGINKNTELKPQKGIHFCIKQLEQPKETYPVDHVEIAQSIAKVKYYRNQKYERLTLCVDVELQDIILKIATMIRKYWDKKKAKQQRVAAKSKKERAIHSVLDYLHKNLQEPRSDYPEMYNDYIERA